MTAIRRVLNSISGGQFPTLYPILEVDLDDALRACLSEKGHTAVDEGLTCVTELLYNQSIVSDRMWGFFFHITDLYLQDKGVIDQSII
jgi:hypothetical protein